MMAAHDVLVVGAGLAGLTSALALQRSGRRVCVLDRGVPGHGTSFGNSGLISPGGVVPIALPGMLRKVPGWLLDRTGPLVLRPAHLPRVFPWLARWVANSRLPQVGRNAAALHALHHASLENWRELLGEAHFTDLVRTTGQVRIWDNDGSLSALEMRICSEYGVPMQSLDRAKIEDLFPGIAPGITSGILLPKNGHTVNPARLTATLAKLLVDAGGQIVSEGVSSIRRVLDGSYFLITDVGNRTAKTVVLTTGVWSNKLLETLGAAPVPLESERGYHAMLPNSNVRLPMPLAIKNRGFALTPMEQGLRIAGTVELAGLEAQPVEARAHILVEHARRVFPALTCDTPTIWMGHRPSTPDSRPFIGAFRGYPGLYANFGHGHFGVTASAPSARLLTQLVNGAPASIDPGPYATDRFAA